LLSGVILLGPAFMPTYSLALIGLGIIAFILLDLVIHRMWFGKLVQAISVDRFMAGLLGINVPFMFTATVIFAFFLAGLAGGLLTPNQSLSPSLSHSYLLSAFIVVIIGGLGNVRGAFVAALVLGLVESLNIILLPSVPGVLIYVAMISFLMWRPHGLFARKDYTPPEASVALSALPPSYRYSIPTGWKIIIGCCTFTFMLSLPAWANGGLVFLAGVTMIEALFALSWNLLFGFTGLASFGHAAFYGVGAYAIGYILKNITAFPFLLALPVAAISGGLLALILGLLAIRRTAGIALAILTLAVSEVFLVIIGASAVLGREDGLAGIPRPTLDFEFFEVSLKTTNSYYFFICGVFLIVSLTLWWLTKSEFGRIIKAIRQDKGRVEFLGIKAERYRLASFTISGAVAALAGALHAPWVQIASPESVFMMHSAQPMLSALLGGVEYFWGPVVGTIIFSVLSILTRTLTGVSDLVSGIVLLAIVIFAPTGILGTLPRLIRIKRFTWTRFGRRLVP